VGTWLRHNSSPEFAGLASHSFVWVVERELHTTIFEKFRAHAPKHLVTGMRDGVDQPFLQYLRDAGGLALGQMFKILKGSNSMPDPLIRSFVEWLRRERPGFSAAFQKIPAERINRRRNREDHADIRMITPDEAATMAEDCRKLLKLIFPN